MEIYNISIDGPSGSGKSTIAKRLSKTLNIKYLDTGAMYRGIAYYIHKKGIDVSDVPAVIENIKDISMDIYYEGEKQKVIVDGEDVTPYIRENIVSMLASTVSKIKEVREKLVSLQREIASKESIILDGRDIGSYVLPDADYKFYMTADVEERAKRRYLELKDKKDVTLEIVKQEMIARDEQDSNRAFAPLCVPNGAYVIDTTNMTIEEVIDIIKNKIDKNN